jgi:hypothetical protein
VLFPVPRLTDVNKDVQVSPELEEVVRRAMAKDPAQRFSSMREFADALLSTPEGAMMTRTGSSPALGSWSGGESTSRPATQVRGTPLAAASSVPPVTSGRSLWLGLGGVLLLAGLGTGAWVLFPRAPEASLDPAQPRPAELPETTAQAATAPGPELAPEAAPGQPAAEPTLPQPPEPAPTPNRVVLQVNTTPAGAVLMKNDFQVCDATPCDVLAEPDETLVLTAQLGARRGQAKVLAQRDQTISIVLGSAPRKAPQPSAPPPPAEGPKLCEVVVDGLKILRPCN